MTEPVIATQSIRVEPSARWVRVKFGGEFIADTRRALLVWEKITPIYFFPMEDVRREVLEPSPEPPEPAAEGATYWQVKVGERVAKNAARGYLEPASPYSALKNYLTFTWHKMEAWYEEEEEIFVHPRDPHKRVDAMLSSRHVRVVIQGEMVAETHRPTLLFETGLPTRYYIPPDDIRMELLEPAHGTTSCPYKGVASYWSVRVGDQIARNIVWSYPEPIPECPKIKGLLSFFNEKVDIYVDGELQARPQTPWS